MIEPSLEAHQHYDFRGGRWWVCDPTYVCDGTHHYYISSQQPR